MNDEGEMFPLFRVHMKKNHYGTVNTKCNMFFAIGVYRLGGNKWEFGRIVGR